MKGKRNNFCTQNPNPFSSSVFWFGWPLSSLQITLSKGQQSRSCFYIQHFFLFNFNPEKNRVLSVVCLEIVLFCFVLFPCRKLCLEPSSEITKPLFSVNMTNRVV